LAAASGVVTYVGYMGTAGNAVIVDNGNGVTTMYYHLSGFNVSTGQSVTAGQTIAYSGNTGATSGPHLHFAVRVNGTYVNPLNYF
jgi:murein DD-endopeptidase MepM/ murein hydrolase activator NlpD